MISNALAQDHGREDAGSLRAGEPRLRALGPSRHDPAKEMLELGLEADRLGHPDRHGPAEGEPMAHHPPDRRPDEQLEGDHRADRVARADRSRASAPAARIRPVRRAAFAASRTASSAPSSSRTERTKSCSPTLMPAVVTSRSQSRARVEVCAQVFGRIAGDAEVHRLATGLSHQRDERVSVAARDLPAAENLLRLVDVHDLVAAAEDGHPGPSVTSGCATASEASTPSWAGPSSVPAVSTVAPFLMSSPARRMLTPTSRSLSIDDRVVPRSVSSCRMTLSAPGEAARR